MLLSSPYVIVISLDFTKAFDMVRHSTMLEKMAKLDMPEYVYNWLVEFFSEHSLYRVQRSDVDSEENHSQYYTRFRIPELRE